MSKMILSPWALALPLVVLLSACSKPVPLAEPVRAVKVITVGAQPLHAGSEFAGEVRARVESRLGFRVGGKLAQRAVEVGQRVKSGQLLARLDPQDFALANDAARAQVSLATASRDQAAADFQRFQELHEKNFISAAELERRSSALKVAQAQLAQAQAQLSGQRNQLRYTQLVADAAGVVTGVDAEPGQVLAAGMPLVRIAQDGARDVVFSVPEDVVASITSGSEVAVRPWSGTQSLHATVREVAASADPATRTFLVKASLAEREVPALGSTVAVRPAALAADAGLALKLPTSALRSNGKGSAVWVLDPASMTVRLQSVEVSAVDGNDVVISSGLQAGMQVVVTGVHVLSPQQHVTIYEANQAVATVGTASEATNLVAPPGNSGK